MSERPVSLPAVTDFESLTLPVPETIGVAPPLTDFIPSPLPLQ